MEDYKIKISALTIQAKTKLITENLTDYFKSKKIDSLEVTYIIKGEYIFFLGYVTDKSDKAIFTHGYYMLTCSLYGEIIYTNQNVICGKSYTLENVIEHTKNYFKYTLSELNK